MGGWRLVVDAGGTNVRFACADSEGKLHRVTSHTTAEFPSFSSALEAYLNTIGDTSRFNSVAIAAAGPIDDGSVTLTNVRNWTVHSAEVSARLAGATVHLINDLQAVAAALPFLRPDDLASIGELGFAFPPVRPMLALNVGTGLGAALAHNQQGSWLTQSSEAGHMALGAVTRQQLALLDTETSVETILSGSGIARLYARISGFHGPVDAADVFSRARTDASAAEVVHVVSDILGRIAGDLVLATGAWGGVVLCGSVAKGWAAVADHAQFRREFERKGAMTTRMSQVPTALVTRADVALFGLAMLQS